MPMRAGANRSMNSSFQSLRLITVALACTAFLLSALVEIARAADYVPNQVVVGYEPGPVPSVTQDLARRMGVRATTAGAVDPRSVVVELPRGVSVDRAVAQLRRTPGVSYAVPNFIAHIASAPSGWIPNDPGRGHARGGWRDV